MINRNNLLLLGGLILLLGAIWWLNKKDEGPSTLKSWEGTFAVKDTASIGKIRIIDRDEQELLLTRDGVRWMVNEKFPVEPRVMREMLETVSQIELLFIPPSQMIPNILKSLAAHGRRVDIWDRKGNVLKTYYVGGVTPDGTGTYMLMEGSERPFVVTMKYFHGSVSVRYFLNEKDWRDRAVFYARPDQIASLTFDYPRERESAFTITRMGRDWAIHPLYEFTEPRKDKPDKDLIESFIEGLGKYKAEAFINDFPGRDSISRQLPFCQISVTLKDSSIQMANIHPVLPTDQDGNPKLSVGGFPVGMERMHINTSRGDYLLVQYELFRPLFATYHYFFKEPPQ
jgi:hypothetical protein